MPRPGCRTCQDPGVIQCPSVSPCFLSAFRCFFPRACAYIINVSLLPDFPSSLKKHVLQHICQSAFYKNVQEKRKKIPWYIWCVCYKVLLLHPLSRTGAAMFWHSDRNGVGTLTYFFCLGLVSFWNSPFEKAEWKKTSENIWKIWNKVLTFAPAFKK